MGTSVKLNIYIIQSYCVVFRCLWCIPDVTCRCLFNKHVPTQAETQGRRTAPCHDSSGLQVFQKMRHELEYSGDEALLGCMKKFHMEMLWSFLSVSLCPFWFGPIFWWKVMMIH